MKRVWKWEKLSDLTKFLQTLKHKKKFWNKKNKKKFWNKSSGYMLVVDFVTSVVVVDYDGTVAVTSVKRVVVAVEVVETSQPSSLFRLYDLGRDGKEKKK